MRKRRNPITHKDLTIDEARTATLLVTEGTALCKAVVVRGRRYVYPTLRIGMCDREALEPAEEVMKARAFPNRTKRRICRPDMFPPDGKGIWRIGKGGKEAQELINRLDPLLTKEFKR